MDVTRDDVDVTRDGTVDEEEALEPRVYTKTQDAPTSVAIHPGFAMPDGERSTT